LVVNDAEGRQLQAAMGERAGRLWLEAGGGGGGDQIGGDGGNGSNASGGAGGLNNGGAGGFGTGNAGTSVGGGGGGAGGNGSGGDGNIGGGGGGCGFNFALFPPNRSGNGGFGGGGGGGNGGIVFGGAGGFGGGGGGGVGAAGFGGGRGGYAIGGGGGGAGMGGAIFSDVGLLNITNSTLSGNFAKGGTAGTSGSIAATVSQGLGGGIFARNAIVNINYVTLNNNSVTDGANVAVPNGGGSLYLIGDGQMNTRGDPTGVTFNVSNTIVANTPAGASDAFVNTINSGTTAPGTNNANLVEVNGSTPGADPNDMPGVTQTGDPMLGPLTLNASGNTPTHALNPGSPAIEQGIAIGGLTTDQRGAPRPADDPAIPNAPGGDGSDIGAFEVAGPGGGCTLTCPANRAQSNDPNQCGAAVTYLNPTTTGTCGTVVCLPASGSFFSVGTTTMSCSISGGPSCSFSVTVQDTQAPTVTCPAHIDATAPTGQSCTAVSYTTPAANDNCPGATVNCLPASGTCFALGTTTVTCTATDASQNTGNCSFTVTVTQQQAGCTISCPANQTASAGAPCPPAGGATTVNYPAPTTTGTCGTVTCSPASASVFPVGTTTVTCSTTAGPSCSFTVTVSLCLQDESNPGRVVLFNPQTGDFSFCCDGVQIASGRGTLTTRGCIGSIDASKGNRQVHIQWDTSANNSLGAGTAYVQKLSSKSICQITDKNMSNNTCQCGDPR
jgi:hypothetical protein